MGVDAEPDGPGPGTAKRWDDEQRLAQLHALIDAIDDAVIGIDLAGDVRSWNRGAERLFGYSEDDIVGRSAALLVPPWGTARWESHVARAIGGEQVERVEAETQRKDGLAVPVTVTITPVVDGAGATIGVSAIARDRSEQQLALETLAEAAERLREGEALAHVGGWVLDRQSGDVQWSEELHRIHGVEPAEFDGTLDGLLSFAHPDDRATVSAALDAALDTGDLFEQEYRIRRPDQATHWVYARAYPVRSGAGDVVGLRGICQDVTGRRVAEDSVRKAYERERAAAEELRAADRLKDEFLASVSHELRTPLTLILGFASLAQQDARAELIEPIARSADDMHEMVERLLDFTRLQAGKVEHQPLHLRLIDEIDRCLEIAERALRDHDVVVEAQPGIVVEADDAGLLRVLTNLLSNAAKFAPAGSTITIRAASVGGRATVSVTDQGRGVPPELQAKVFDRFFQGPDQPPGKRGTGIGLAIAKRSIELMGGRIWCDASVVSGATFAFTLPLVGAGGAPEPP